MPKRVKDSVLKPYDFFPRLCPAVRARGFAAMLAGTVTAVVRCVCVQAVGILGTDGARRVELCRALNRQQASQRYDGQIQ